MMLFEIEYRSLVLLRHHLRSVLLLIDVKLVLTEYVLAEIFR